MRRSRSTAWFALSLALALFACDDADPGTPSTDAAPPDAAEATLDVGLPDALPDAAPDAMPDAQPDAEPAPDAGPIEPPSPWSPGPYGTHWRDLAGPWTLNTTEGPFDYQARFTETQESVVFAFYADGYDYPAELWASDVAQLIATSPHTVNYVFGAYANADNPGFNPATFIERFQLEVDAHLRDLPVEEKRHWFEHVHFVTEPAQAFDGWLGDAVRAHSTFNLALDRTQRLRQVGNLGSPLRGFAPELRHLAFEARYFDYELNREADLAATLAAAGHVSTLELDRREGDAPHVDHSHFTVQWPEDIDRYDRLLVDLTMHCPDHDDQNCGEWDYLAALRLCETIDGEERCDEEVGRWITTYLREGRWLTDLTPMLAKYRAYGWPSTLRLASGRQPNGGTYEVKVTLHLLDEAAEDHPDEWIPLFTGGPFTPEYNDTREPIAFTVPEAATRVELVTLITGHGFGGDEANCAEFCNHTHHFTVGGETFIFDQPWVGNREGCAAQVDDGVVPNQYGTWVFGRGGWCPGLDVKPWVVDLTDVVQPGENTISYEGHLNGLPYMPVLTNPDAYAANIIMQSAIVIWSGP
jgi:hypothetical protein